MFSVKDILLVRRQDLFYFQIGKNLKAVRKATLTVEAGLEDCKCLEENEPTDGLELQSFREILELVGGPKQADRFDLISDLITALSNSQVLGSIEMTAVRERVEREDEKQKAKQEELKAKHGEPKEKHEMFPTWSKDIHRMELEIYFHAVRVLGTTVGGTFAKTKTSANM